MCIPVHPPWLPGYMDVVQTVLVTLALAGVFLDRPCILCRLKYGCISLAQWFPVFWGMRILFDTLSVTSCTDGSCAFMLGWFKGMCAGNGYSKTTLYAVLPSFVHSFEDIGGASETPSEYTQRPGALRPHHALCIGIKGFSRCSQSSHSPKWFSL